MTIGRPRLVVVGGGVIGTMHAREGVRRGYEVVQIERDATPRGASVRNFGLVWVSGRSSGVELELALRARVLWEELAGECMRMSFRPSGSLTIARSPEEHVALGEASTIDDAAERGFELLSGDEARARFPALGKTVQAALWCGRDAIVEPRLVLGAIRGYLAESATYTWLPNRHAMQVRPHGVLDHTGAWHEGDLVVCCIGAFPGAFIEEELRDAPLRRVRLQMLETAPYDGEVPVALADGDSLRYYPAYQGRAADALLPQAEIASMWNAQLLLVKRQSGHLTIGDTHTHEEPFAFDIADAPYEHLVGVAEDILGPLPPVERRWSGVYSQITEPSALYFRKEIAPGVVVVTGPGGRGMTMSPAIAEETFQ